MGDDDPPPTLGLLPTGLGERVKARRLQVRLGNKFAWLGWQRPYKIVDFKRGADAVSEKRHTERAKLFLAATLHAGGGSRNVTVRNLSLGGALIEMPSPPPVGTAVELRRAHLKAGGTIVWTGPRECGVHFDMPLALHDWLPNTSRAGQDRVDEAVAQYKSGAPAPAQPAVAGAATSSPVPGALNSRLCEELGFVARLLEALGDQLAEDLTVTARHGAKLQDLDIAIQILGHVGAILAADDPQAAIARIGMADLRRRLAPKSL